MSHKWSVEENNWVSYLRVKVTFMSNYMSFVSPLPQLRSRIDHTLDNSDSQKSWAIMQAKRKNSDDVCKE